MMFQIMVLRPMTLEPDLAILVLLWMMLVSRAFITCLSSMPTTLIIVYKTFPSKIVLFPVDTYFSV